MISKIGMKMIRAKGSRFDRTSLGRPLVIIVAACEVKLLFSWLYVSPEHYVAFSKAFPDPLKK